MSSSSKGTSSSADQQAQANLANQMTTTAGVETKEGAELFNMALPGLEQSETYYGKLASGDPNALARANAPAIQSITKESDSAKKKIIQDQPRGGERNLALEESDISSGAQISQLETGSYTSAFGSLAGLGGQNVSQGSSLQSSGTQGMNAAANQYGQLSEINAQNKAETTGFYGSMGGSLLTAAGECWVAAELYGGWEDRRTCAVRFWLRHFYSKTFVGWIFVNLYHRYGIWAASKVRKYRLIRSLVKPLFDWFLLQAGKV